MTGGAENRYGRPDGCAAEFDDETGRCMSCGLGWLLSSKTWPPCRPMTIGRYRDAINLAVSAALGSFSIVHDLAKQGRAADPVAALNRAMELEAVRRAFLLALDDPQIRAFLKKNLNTKRQVAEDHDSNG